MNISEIARRYFVMNAFDGVLTIIGVLVGNLTAGVEDPNVVLSTGLATSVVMGISGLWGCLPNRVGRTPARPGRIEPLHFDRSERYAHWPSIESGSRFGGGG